MILTILLKTYFFLFQKTKLSTVEEAQQLKANAEKLELSRLTTLLSIALITILVLLIISVYKNQKLKQEVMALKSE